MSTPLLGGLITLFPFLTKSSHASSTNHAIVFTAILLAVTASSSPLHENHRVRRSVDFGGVLPDCDKYNDPISASTRKERSSISKHNFATSCKHAPGSAENDALTASKNNECGHLQTAPKISLMQACGGMDD
jgi:hypothetical protein